MAVNGGNKSLSCMKKKTEENLPHELVIEIISRLPSHHLYPLRFVSKSWLQLLTKDPQFAKLQLHRFIKSNPSPSIIVPKQSNDSYFFLATEFESCDKALTLQYPFSQDINKYNLLGNCNGLLCFNHIGDHNQVYIWNPIINDHITISCLPEPSSRFPGYSNSTVFGFGFDEDSSVYKVVRFFTEAGVKRVPLSFERGTQISVYTIGVDSMWRTVQVDLPCDVPPPFGVLPFVNGALHYNAIRLFEESPHQIFTFDLKREVIGELLPPCGINFNDIVELGGLFCVVDISDESEMHIWVMKEYGIVSSWTKQYVIAKSQGRFVDLFPLSFTHNREILMQTYSRKLALYSPETNTFRDLNSFPDEINLPYAYIGSIISPTAISRVCHNLLEEES